MIRLRTASVAAIALAAALGSAPAFADKAAGDACAAALSPDGKAIYVAVMGAGAGGDLRSVVTDTTKSLVMSGKIDRGNARTNAQAAGACLQQARS